MKRILMIGWGVWFLSMLLGPPLFSQGWEWQNPLPQGNDLRSMDAVDENHVWFGTSAGVVLHTFDGGQSWQLQQTPTQAYIYGIDFVDQEYGWAMGEEEGIGGVILHSTDGGRTWHRLSPPTDLSPFFRMHAVEFLDRKVGWSVGVSGLVLHTKNGGQSWEKQNVTASDGFFRDLEDLSVIDNLRVWVAGNFTLAHTEDGGKTWHTDTTEVGRYDFRQVFFVDQAHGWAVSEFGGKLFKTTDGGKNWVPGNGNMEEGIFQVFFLNPDSGWANGSKGIYWTTNGGEHWEKISEQLIGNFVFVNEKIGWSGFKAGTDILRTTDGGHSWEKLSRTITKANLQAVDFVNSQTGWVVGSGGTILATKDGGQHWIRQQSGVDTRLTDVMFLNSELGWAVGFSGTVLRTQNGGETWELLQQIPGRNTNRAIFFVDSLTGWLVGGDVLEPGWIRHTTDGGETWIEQTPGTIPRMFDVYFLDKNTGWVVGESGHIWHTRDGGTNWELQESGVNANLVVVEFTSPLNGWISVGGNFVLHTINGGANWDVINIDGFQGGLGDLSFVDDNHGWIAGGLGVIFSTEDGGATWKRQPSGTTITFHSVDFANLNEGWVVGNSGVILHTSTGGITSVQPRSEISPFPSTFHLYPTFPNPFNSQTKIRFDIKKPLAHVSLIIYDVLGRRVSELVNARLREGSYEVIWDGTNENKIPSPSGVYFTRLQVDGQTQTQNMLLLR